MATQNIEINYYTGYSYDILYPKTFTNIERGSYIGNGTNSISIALNSSPYFLAITQSTKEMFFVPFIINNSYVYQKISGMNGISGGISVGKPSDGTKLYMANLSVGVSWNNIVTIRCSYHYILEILTTGAVKLSSDTDSNNFENFGFYNINNVTYPYIALI